MKKLINGKVVNIQPDVLELFEKAMEGNVTKKALANKIDIALESDTGHMGDIIASYYSTYIRLPYPLYAVEEEIKYATIAAQLQRSLEGTIGYKPRVQVVDNKVSVFSEDGYCIELASDSWAVTVPENTDDIPAKDVSLDDYKTDVLYRFYAWCEQKLIRKETLSNFYTFAVPGVLDACGRKPLIVKWELAKLLQFADIPVETKVVDRHIVDVDTETDYFLDVFWEGEMDESNKRSVMVIDIRKNAEQLLSETKSKKKYNYEVYENNKESGRLKLKASKKRFESIFNAIADACHEGADIDTIQYHGVISDGYIAIEIENKLYVGTTHDGISEIGMDTKIVSICGSKVYVNKSIKKPKGAVREAVYIYDIVSDTLKICNVQYGKEGAKSENK